MSIKTFSVNWRCAIPHPQITLRSIEFLYCYFLRPATTTTSSPFSPQMGKSQKHSRAKKCCTAVYFHKHPTPPSKKKKLPSFSRKKSIPHPSSWALRKKVKRRKGKRIKMCVFPFLLLLFSPTEAQRGSQQQKLGLLYNFWLLLASYQLDIPTLIYMYNFVVLLVLVFFE